MKKFKLWASLVLVVVTIGAGLYAFWELDWRWRPKTIDSHQAEIAQIIEHAGWVSPGHSGPKLYMISFRTCPDCVRYKQTEFPKLHRAKVDTRVIVIARADKNGVENSTPAERSAVAELWANRSWALLEAWNEVPPEAWTAPGVLPADNDIGRTAIVEAGRKTVVDLTPLLRANGIDFAYPLLIWWTKDGQMHGCACESPKTYAKVRKELGA